MNELFNGCYAGRKVLVTGHTGFKGSWLCLWLKALGADVSGLALPPDTHPSHWSLLRLAGVHDHHVDLRDQGAIIRTVSACQPEIIFHLAAQPLVRRSYREPTETFDTNVMGLVHLLQAARHAGSVKALVNATTDKVYKEQPTSQGYSEEAPLGGHDPYSTSKACAELVTECFRKSFFDGTSTKVATARAGNVIGGGDWAEDRLIPDLVRAIVSNESIVVRYPRAIRPWQHTLDSLAGYLSLGCSLLEQPHAEGAWNFGPSQDAWLTVNDVIDRFGKEWAEISVEQEKSDQPHEAQILTLDSTKSTTALGWRPVWDASVAVRHTATWYRAYYERNEIISGAQLDQYVADARAAALEWAA